MEAGLEWAVGRWGGGGESGRKGTDGERGEKGEKEECKRRVKVETKGIEWREGNGR